MWDHLLDVLGLAAFVVVELLILRYLDFVSRGDLDRVVAEIEAMKDRHAQAEQRMAYLEGLTAVEDDE